MVSTGLTDRITARDTSEIVRGDPGKTPTHGALKAWAAGSCHAESYEPRCRSTHPALAVQRRDPRIQAYIGTRLSKACWGWIWVVPVLITETALMGSVPSRPAAEPAVGFVASVMVFFLFDLRPDGSVEG